MSLLHDLPTRMRELGRLRMGSQATTVSKKTGQPVSYPVRSNTWRFTSQSPELLGAVAELYGGEVEPWPEAPGEGRFYQVSSDASSVDVLIPVAYSLSQHYELWTADGCARRCDGRTNLITDSPCVCPKDISARMEAAAGAKPTACKPTTRLNVLLPEIPDLGFWRMEAHGYQAAIEIPGALAMYVGLARQAAGPGADVDSLIVRAELAIEPRRSKKPGKPPADYVVPVIRTPQVTPNMLMAGSGSAAQLGSAVPAAGELGPGDFIAAEDPPDAVDAALPQLPTPPAMPEPEPFDEAAELLVGPAAGRGFAKRAAGAGLDEDEIAQLVGDVTGGRTQVPAHVRKTEWDALGHRLDAVVEGRLA